MALIENSKPVNDYSICSRAALLNNVLCLTNILYCFEPLNADIVVACSMRKQ